MRLIESRGTIDKAKMGKLPRIPDLPSLVLGGETAKAKLTTLRAGETQDDVMKQYLKLVSDHGKDWEPPMMTYIRECNIAIRKSKYPGGARIRFKKDGAQYEFYRWDAHGNAYAVYEIDRERSE